MKSRFTWVLLFVLTLMGTVNGHPPTGIVVDKAGNVYFTDLETIWKLDNRDTLRIFRAGVRGRHVHELAIDKDGNLYGADISYVDEKWVSAVWKMSPSGQFTDLIAPTTDPPRGAGIFIDEKGNMYSVDQNNHTKQQTLILRRDPNGTVTTLAGSSYGQLDGKGTVARFSSINSMAFGPDGSLYVTDGASLRRVTMAGDVTTLARDLNRLTNTARPTLFGTRHGMLTGLSVDHSGNVFLIDADNQRLLKVNSAGGVEVVFRGEPPYSPNGVFVTQGGDLYVLEIGVQEAGQPLLARVRKIATDGRNSIVAVSGKETAEASNEASQHVLPTRGTSIPRLLAMVGGALILGIALIVWQRSRKQQGRRA